ncbi:hypothetical protein PoB_005498100 [Plakobranchus ocellatus]|uniref:Uncharacterized protein n=1 Tax=Plakobranchus ocellatus TaxID=259542 RepID=A0AAV4C6Z6_9GAST|nr:hypothetical protein PoB_005498100 [Plakobranchus ocellatus]
MDTRDSINRFRNMFAHRMDEQKRRNARPSPYEPCALGRIAIYSREYTVAFMGDSSRGDYSGECCGIDLYGPMVQKLGDV